jgi:SpoVK/Ycf46/Vps4 family AAA+-type ATPase
VIQNAGFKPLTIENAQSQSEGGLKCTSCLKINRSIANYCRFCGCAIERPALQTSEQMLSQSLPVSDNYGDFIGLESIKTKMQNFIDRLKIENEQKKQGLVLVKNTSVIVFRGETGTGKSTVAESFISKLQKSECLESKRVERVTAKAFKRSYADEFAVSQYLAESKSGVLLVDEVQEDDNYLHELLLGFTKKTSDTICILLGTKEPLDEFFKKNPEDVQRVTDFYEFPKISDENLKKILQRKISEIGFVIDEEINDSFDECIQESKNDVKCVYKNGWLVEKEILKKIRSNQAARLQKNLANLKKEDYKRILLEDLPINSKPVTSEEVLARLDELIGMDNVKKAVKELAQTIAVNKQREKQGLLAGKLPAIHIVFTGNPGTGKTTVARLLGQLFHAMKLLPSSKVIETDRSKLVGQYVGSTAPLVNEMCDKAMGGILFIDEAYTLAGDGINTDSFGKEAIDTLLKRMEDDRGKFVVIAAGYEKEMQNFISANPGLKSRFTHFLHLEDYNTDELFELFKLYAKKDNYVISPQTGEVAYSAIAEIWKNKGKDFANGRTIRNLFDDAVRHMSSRIASLPAEQQTKESLTTFMPEDIPHSENKKLSAEEVLSQLDELIGMGEVKRNIRELCQTIQMNRKREEMGVGTKKPSIHIVFTGNPGTGKTTVARLLGKLFYSMELLPSDKVIEVDKSGMVGQYVGETPKLVNKVVDNALGGVLFIDEAYTLAGDGINKDSFGKEAIDTLLKRMEDDRGKFVVIAAGYKKEMQNFIEANPGLKSRFTHFIHLEDYNPDELFQLYQLYSKGSNYTIEENALSVIKDAVTEMYNSRGKDFANGRTVRNFFDDTVRRMSSRVANLPVEQQTKETLTTITVADIPFDQKKNLSTDEIFAQLDELIGMNDVKKAVRELCQTIQMNQERERQGISAKTPAIHIVFTGNPGTGKTTVARILSRLFNAIGLLPSDKLVETDRSGLVGQYVGSTAPLVNEKCDKAMGGVLFIDEAYTLAEGGGNDYGKEAIDALLKRMEDDRGKFVVIAAGYKKEMQNFIEANPGLKSRFTHFIHLEDYNPGELYQLFNLYAEKSSYKISDDAKELVQNTIQRIWENRGRDFANGRTIRNYFDSITRKMDSRLASIPSESRTGEVLTTITAEDVSASEEKR